jgi:hypothetical protein
MPFTSVVFQACYGGVDNPTKKDWNEVFEENKAWLIITNRIKESSQAINFFVRRFVDRVTDWSRSYEMSITNGVNFVNNRLVIEDDNYRDIMGFNFGVRVESETTGHDFVEDHYRFIKRKEAFEGVNFNKNDPIKTLTWSNPYSSPHGNRQPHGMYVIFHGIIDDNYSDDDKGTLRMRIRGDGVVKHDWEDWVVDNREVKLNGKPEFLTGTDMVTLYIAGTKVDDWDTIQVDIDFNSNSATCSKIKIHRFEVIQIARLTP